MEDNAPMRRRASAAAIAGHAARPRSPCTAVRGPGKVAGLGTVSGRDTGCSAASLARAMTTPDIDIKSFEIETKNKLNCITRSNYAPEALTGEIRDIIYIEVCKSRG